MGDLIGATAVHLNFPLLSFSFLQRKFLMAKLFNYYYKIKMLTGWSHREPHPFLSDRLHLCQGVT